MQINLKENANLLVFCKEKLIFFYFCCYGLNDWGYVITFMLLRVVGKQTICKFIYK